MAQQLDARGQRNFMFAEVVVTFAPSKWDHTVTNDPDGCTLQTKTIPMISRLYLEAQDSISLLNLSNPGEVERAVLHFHQSPYLLRQHL